jgi:hypothetical protein
MRGEDLIAEGRWRREKMKDNIVFSWKRGSLALGDKAIVCPPALLDGRKSFPAQVSMLCINSNSKNKDLAAEFLSVYCSKEVQTVRIPTDEAFYKDISLYPPIPEEDGKFFNDKSINIYENMFKYSVREQVNFNLRDYMSDTISKYMNDEISLDEAVTLIDNKAKLVVGE